MGDAMVGRDADPSAADGIGDDCRDGVRLMLLLHELDPSGPCCTVRTSATIALHDVVGTRPSR